MLVVHPVDPVKFLPLFWEIEPPERWADICVERGFIAFIAMQEDGLGGYAVAESRPQVLHVLDLEGNADTCLRLLERLAKMAGERDMSGWFPGARTDIQKMLEGLGFIRQKEDLFQNCLWYLYFWSRNED
jgi:hypothetical protein